MVGVAFICRTFKFKRFLILIWTFCGFMGTSTSNIFLFTFTVFSDMVKTLTLITLCYWGGGGGGGVVVL